MTEIEWKMIVSQEVQKLSTTYKRVANSYRVVQRNHAYETTASYIIHFQQRNYFGTKRISTINLVRI